MAKPIICNVNVSMMSDQQLDNMEACVRWESGGARYHFWTKLPAFEPQRAMHNSLPCLYKNPPRDVKPGQRDYFKTRYLDAGSKVNSEMITEVVALVKHYKLADKAIADRAAKVAADEAAAKEEARQRRIDEKAAKSGKSLMAALAAVINDDHYGQLSQATRELVAKAIEAVESEA